MRSVSAAPTCASTEWRAPAVTSSSGEPSRSGTVSESPPALRPANPGCCDFLTRFDFIRFPRSNCCVIERISSSASSTWRFRKKRSGSAITTPFSNRIDTEATAFKAKQQAAFEAERERWKSTEFVTVEEPGSMTIPDEVQLPEHGSFIDAPVAGNLWKLIAKAGDQVQLDQPVAIIESMKMEMQVCAIRSGTVHSVFCQGILSSFSRSASLHHRNWIRFPLTPSIVLLPPPRARRRARFLCRPRKTEHDQEIPASSPNRARPRRRLPRLPRLSSAAESISASPFLFHYPRVCFETLKRDFSLSVLTQE